MSTKLLVSTPGLITIYPASIFLFMHRLVRLSSAAEICCTNLKKNDNHVSSIAKATVIKQLR